MYDESIQRKSNDRIIDSYHPHKNEFKIIISHTTTSSEREISYRTKKMDNCHYFDEGYIELKTLINCCIVVWFIYILFLYIVAIFIQNFVFILDGKSYENVIARVDMKYDDSKDFFDANSNKYTINYVMWPRPFNNEWDGRSTKPEICAEWL